MIRWLGFDDSTTMAIYHTNNVLVYVFSIVGGAIADAWLGKYRCVWKKNHCFRSGVRHVTLFITRILSASAIHGGVRCVLLYMVRGDATLSELTMGPYASPGMCIINYTPPEINIVAIAKALFDCSSQSQPYSNLGVRPYSCTGHLVPYVTAVKEPHYVFVFVPYELESDKDSRVCNSIIPATIHVGVLI